MKKYIIISILVLGTINIFAQKDKMPTQADLQKMMKGAQKELDNLDPKAKNIMDSMGINMSDMNASPKIMSDADQSHLQKEWSRQTVTIPAIDKVRISAISTTPSKVNISTYIRSTQNKLYPTLGPAIKLFGEKLYSLFKSTGKTTREIGNAAAGFWMMGKTEMAVYILSKSCSDNPNNDNNLSNYAAMLSMSGMEELAIPLLNILNKDYPKNSIILNNLGQAWFGLGDMAKASKYLDSAILISGAATQALLTKAKIEESKGNKTEAVELVKKSIKISYSEEKNVMLHKLGYKLTAKDVSLPAPNKPDQLGLSSFQPPAFPKSVEECILMEKPWDYFRKMLEDEGEKLAKEIGDVAPSILPASKKRFTNGESIVPIHVDVANLKMAEAKKTFDRQSQEWEKQYASFLEERGQFLHDEYEATMDRLRKEDFEQTGEGKPNKNYCPDYRAASDKYLSAYNSELEDLYIKLLAINRVYLNEIAGYSVYAYWPEELTIELASIKGSYLGVLKEGPKFQSITEYTCKEIEKKPGSNKLVRFDDVACQYHSEMNLIIGSIKMDCSRMTTELDLSGVKVGLTQDMDKENFSDQFVNCTVEVTKSIGNADVTGVAGAEVSGGVGIDIGRNGINDVYVIGKGEVGAGVGPASTSKGFEGKISLISGDYSGGFK